MKDKKNINTLLLVLFLYSSSIVSIITNLTGFVQTYKLFILLILITSLAINGFKVKVEMILFISPFLIYHLLSLFFVDYLHSNSYFLMEFLKFGVLTMFLSSLNIDRNLFIKYMYIVGLINIVILQFNYFIFNENFNYMSYGIYMCLSLISILIKSLETPNTVNIFLIVLNSSLILVFANRSSILIAIVLLFLFVWIKLKVHLLYRYIYLVSIISFGLVFYFYGQKLILFILYKLNEIGIYSYSFSKFARAFNYGFVASSSGRDVILSEAIDLIKLNNYYPAPVGYFMEHTTWVYPHNIFIEVILNYGFLGPLFLLIVTTYIIFKISKIKNKSIKYFYIFIFIFVIIRLSFSNTYWSEPLLWGAIGMLLFNQNLNKEQSAP